MKGEKSANLFPKPVHEESPFIQREKMQKQQRQELEKKNKVSTYSPDMDTIRYSALCRGDDFRVSGITVDTLSSPGICPT